MNILVACEESQRVTTELRKLGHTAFSCDILPTSGNYPCWHINSDVLPLLNGKCSFKTQDGVEHFINSKWDMLICFPPCTDLCISGARHFARKQADGTQKKSIEFFMKFVNADCDKIAIENPVGIMSNIYRKPNQIVNPFQFGDRFKKKTCLWLKGLPNLVSTEIVSPEEDFIYPNGKHYPQWMMCSSKDRSIVRSKTFPGIARAMAEQWTFME